MFVVKKFTFYFPRQRLLNYQIKVESQKIKSTKHTPLKYWPETYCFFFDIFRNETFVFDLKLFLVRDILRSAGFNKYLLRDIINKCAARMSVLFAGCKTVYTKQLRSDTNKKRVEVAGVG